MTISETVLILAGGAAVLAILFGIRLAMRAVARLRDRAAGRWRLKLGLSPEFLAFGGAGQTPSKRLVRNAHDRES